MENMILAKVQLLLILGCVYVQISPSSGQSDCPNGTFTDINSCNIECHGSPELECVEPTAETPVTPITESNGTTTPLPAEVPSTTLDPCPIKCTIPPKTAGGRKPGQQRGTKAWQIGLGAGVTLVAIFGLICVCCCVHFKNKKRQKVGSALPINNGHHHANMPWQNKPDSEGSELPDMRALTVGGGDVQKPFMQTDQGPVWDATPQIATIQEEPEKETPATPQAPPSTGYQPQLEYNNFPSYQPRPTTDSSALPTEPYTGTTNPAYQPSLTEHLQQPPSQNEETSSQVGQSDYAVSKPPSEHETNPVNPVSEYQPLPPINQPFSFS